VELLPSIRQDGMLDRDEDRDVPFCISLLFQMLFEGRQEQHIHVLHQLLELYLAKASSVNQHDRYLFQMYCYRHLKLVDKARALWQEMKKPNQQPISGQLYSEYITTICQGNCTVEEVLPLLQEVMSQKLKINRAPLLAVASKLEKAGNKVAADRLRENAVKADSELVAVARTKKNNNIAVH